jgi:Flp pilus assembly protein TadG
MTRNKSERGQSLVELAISITVVVFLLSGAIEFGMMFFQYIQLRDAAQEGALYGSLNPTDASGIEARVRGASSSPVDLTIAYADPIGVDVDIEYFEGSSPTTTKDVAAVCPGDGIKIIVKYKHKIFMPFMTPIIRDPSTTTPYRTLTGTVTDTILNSPTSGCP